MVFFRPQMNISSVIVNARPGQLDAVRGRLQGLPGIEIHAATADGKFVVTIEADSEGETAHTFDRINTLEGVLSAALVYHQFESDPHKEA